MKTGVVIVAAGAGQRAGGSVPKQEQDFLGRPVFKWSLDAFTASPFVDEVVIVVPAGAAERYRQNLTDGLKLAEGGSTRSESVRAGLRALTLGDTDIVLIHDAARPGIDQATIERLLSALQSGADAAAPALPVSDALKRYSEGVLDTVSRDRLYRVQTPQAFRYGAVRDALEAAYKDLVDDLSAMEAIGARIQLIPGSERLGKLTYPEDFTYMAQLLGSTGTPRVGTGFDVHAFGPGDGVTLCGIRIPHSHSLAGHSDADVGYHALTDAVLGAVALGDIGDHFPPSDPQWAGADSAVFLRAAVDLAKQAGFSLSSCDITLICEAPKVKPHREAMRAAVASVTGLDIGQVSIKATTTEGLGFTGRREGIAAQAVAVLSPV